MGLRVRYQMVGMGPVARCDLQEWQARKLYKDLFCKGLCEWAELVGEEEEDYMDVLESFDHTDMARMIASIIGRI